MDPVFFKTYLDTLASEIRDCADRVSLQISFAAERVIASYLGYDEEDIEFVDGAGDRGIDFWYSSEGGLYLYQVKTHQFTEEGQINYWQKFGNEGVLDIIRAQQFLVSDELIPEDHKLNKIKETFRRLLRNHQSQEIQNPLHVYITLIILGEALTDAAFAELANFESTLEEPMLLNDVSVQFHVSYQTIKDIVASNWRQVNEDWKDRNGKKRNTIRLTPLRQTDKRDYLNDNKSAIFYSRAVDLVEAYEDFGYQIFAPNVRANIKNSNVNSAIQESASHGRSMKEFRFLNNGLTIICNSYKLPSGQRPSFEVTEPGIVNGLQTVVALHRAYYSLQEKARNEFDEDCFVLVRLLRTDAVDQISEVVLATNNQNPMQPRNLVSNSSEQTHFFLYFAQQLGWFYESKQGAWEAFRKDEKNWRPRINRTAAYFKAQRGYKKIDNLDLAQDWLAFLGFAERAANDRKHLFDTDKEYYKLIFLSRMQDHAYWGKYKSLTKSLENSDSDTPDPSTMLAAHLAHSFVDNVVPSGQLNRKEALARYGIGLNELSPVDEAKTLSEDYEYTLNQALGTMSLVFVEFVGLTMFKVLGSDAHKCGSSLLKKYSWNAIYTNLDWQTAVDKARGIDKNLDNNDLLIVMWLFFREAVQTLLSGAWQVPYRNTRYKPRFVLNNREQIYQEITTMDQSIQRRVPIRIWSYGMQEGEGFFGYVTRVLSS